MILDTTLPPLHFLQVKINTVDLFLKPVNTSFESLIIVIIIVIVIPNQDKRMELIMPEFLQRRPAMLVAFYANEDIVVYISILYD